MGYFHSITGSAENTDLAYDYFVDHVAWNRSANGRSLLECLRDRLPT
ncbi:hypothetical protein [Streptomyces sp. NPDC002602]